MSYRYRDRFSHIRVVLIRMKVHDIQVVDCIQAGSVE